MADREWWGAVDRPCFARSLDFEAAPPPAYPVLGIADVGPTGSGLGLRTKDAIAYAKRLDGYISDLDHDIDTRVAYSDADPSTLGNDTIAKLKKLPGGSGLDAAASAERARLKALQAGKSASQLASEAAFSAGWESFKREWEDFWLKTVSPWSTTITAVARDADWQELGKYEAAIMEWRKRFRALGYEPSKPAPTSAEIDALQPKKTDYLAGVLKAVPWVAGAIIVASLAGVVRR